jgi:GNAT superfamily N-acetyltransferase
MEDDSVITIRQMYIEEAYKIGDIDRSEFIESTFKMKDGKLEQIAAGHESLSWDNAQISGLIFRFKQEVDGGGHAVGAYEGEQLIGFGLLGHKIRGVNKDQLQVDLLYVSRGCRRQGIGRRIMDELSQEARRRNAAYLYISSAETQSAVQFYRGYGGELAKEVDPELFAREPEDIHMLKKL